MVGHEQDWPAATVAVVLGRGGVGATAAGRSWRRRVGVRRAMDSSAACRRARPEPGGEPMCVSATDRRLALGGLVGASRFCPHGPPETPIHPTAAGLRAYPVATLAAVERHNSNLGLSAHSAECRSWRTRKTSRTLAGNWASSSS